MDIKTEIAELKSRINILEQQLIELPKEFPFEIAPKISERECKWEDAISYCEFLGHGWRLPYLNELDLIYQTENDFGDNTYWSDTTSGGIYVWLHNMSNGNQFRDSKVNSRYYVRPIRDLVKSKLPFEIADISTEIKSDWDSAVEYVKRLGNEWRLPSINELDLIYQTENDFGDNTYWTSTEGNGNGAWGQNVSNGNQFNYSKNFGGNYVRPIRNLVKSKLPFVIAAKAFEIKSDWDSAVEYVKTLGKGWRLPTKDELTLIYQTANDFGDNTYWSTTEPDGDYAWIQDMSCGYQNFHNKYGGNFYVRAVKDIN
jgi:hypothetical protein